MYHAMSLAQKYLTNVKKKPLGKTVFYFVLQSFHHHFYTILFNIHSLQAPKQFKRKVRRLVYKQLSMKNINKLNIFIPRFWWNSVNSNTAQKMSLCTLLATTALSRQVQGTSFLNWMIYVRMMISPLGHQAQWLVW